MTLKIEPLAQAHLESVWQIEQIAHSHPWGQATINNLSGRGACNYALLDNDKLVGYFYAQIIVDELTLLNIAIDPQYQGRGMGKKLMTEFLLIGERSSAESAWLEVRESNSSAFGLYQAMGFNEVDRRPNYYPTSKGREDAIIMSYLFL